MEIIDFSKINVLVIGDVMLDVYYKGSVERISPEAPVPVVRVNSVTYGLGGAANVCNNIFSLGAKTTLIGFVGDDDNCNKISTFLNDSGINAKLVKTKSPTITKMRILGEHQQIVRVDFEDKKPNYSEDEYSALKNNIINEIEKSSIIIISDYKKGVTKESICKIIIDNANKNNKMVIVDPKGNDWNKYIGADYITPNLKELKEIVNREFGNENDEIVRSGLDVIKSFNLKNLLVTRSEKGMSLITEN
ncbi:MAG TPA: PfkB family carbohydrate kinase, partial [Spirochaetota bacterium]|nr:PfkB family carbohydrate kinase [Spirochaetota bacterium]